MLSQSYNSKELYIIKMNKVNLLVPRNLESRFDKLKQLNYKLLQQEIIDGNLYIDKSFEFDFSNLSIKTKQINGNVYINLKYIPEWLENIRINGDFICVYKLTTSLKGCPKYIEGDFRCYENQLESLEFCPKYVGGDFCCFNNEAKFTTYYVRSLCDVKGLIFL